MALFAVLLVAVLATLGWRLLVPRVRVEDDESPDFASLVTGQSTLAVALAAVLAGQVLWLTPQSRWWLWVPYLGLGLPLVAVDLRTTFLPLRLNYLVAGAMAACLVPLTVHDWRSGVGALAGAAALFALFHLVWRFARGIGYGDVRLALLVGAVSGMAGVQFAALALLAGTALGAVHAIAHAIWARRDPARERHFAYGPALWAGPTVAALLSPIVG